MEAILPLAVGVGLVVSLVFSELFGLAAGGMVVPGYIALNLTEPSGVILTFAAAVFTYWCVLLLSNVMILYGRRRTAMTILIGYLVGVGLRHLTGGVVGLGHEYDVVGYIIPGLIALWLARQGIVETLVSIVTVSVVTRLALVFMVGQELLR